MNRSDDMRNLLDNIENAKEFGPVEHGLPVFEGFARWGRTDEGKWRDLAIGAAAMGALAGAAIPAGKEALDYHRGGGNQVGVTKQDADFNNNYADAAAQARAEQEGTLGGVTADLGPPMQRAVGLDVVRKRTVDLGNMKKRTIDLESADEEGPTGNPALRNLCGIAQDQFNARHTGLLGGAWNTWADFPTTEEAVAYAKHVESLGGEIMMSKKFADRNRVYARG
jgi:hypothetical protein